MTLYLRILLFATLLVSSVQAASVLHVMTCEPEWAALVRELAGDRAKVTSATTAFQDPHHIEARPSLIALARSADLLVCTGAELEAGWLPLLQRGAGNPVIQTGQPGYFEATQFVRLLEIPTRQDVAEGGHIHTAGNPHIQTDPRNIALVAQALAQRLGEIDPGNAAQYAARYKDFAARWKAAITRWEQAAAPLKGVSIVVQHRGFPYLENWLGLKQVAALEAKLGVEPSSAHLSRVLAQLQKQPAKMTIRAAYNDGRASEWLMERGKIPVVVLPYTVGGSDKARDLFGLFDDTIDKLLATMK
jgi:zinc/manganese transport system substrate-binding protein